MILKTSTDGTCSIALSKTEQGILLKASGLLNTLAQVTNNEPALKAAVLIRELTGKLATADEGPAGDSDDKAPDAAAGAFAGKSPVQGRKA